MHFQPPVRQGLERRAEAPLGVRDRVTRAPVCIARRYIYAGLGLKQQVIIILSDRGGRSTLSQVAVSASLGGAALSAGCPGPAGSIRHAGAAASAPTGTRPGQGRAFGVARLSRQRHKLSTVESPSPHHAAGRDHPRSVERAAGAAPCDPHPMPAGLSGAAAGDDRHSARGVTHGRPAPRETGAGRAAYPAPRGGDGGSGYKAVWKLLPGATWLLEAIGAAIRLGQFHRLAGTVRTG